MDMFSIRATRAIRGKNSFLKWLVLSNSSAEQTMEKRFPWAAAENQDKTILPGRRGVFLRLCSAILENHF